MNELRILFMGTPDFAIPSLNILLKSNCNIVCVVTTPDKPKGRGLKNESSSIKKFAIKNSLPILEPVDLKGEDFREQIKKLDPDLIVVVAFKILPKEIFTIPKFGSFNLHASLLPKYRGAAPINWAIIKGEKETGVTTFFLEEKVDTGKMIIQEKISIEENDNAGELHDKLSILGSEVTLKTVQLIQSGNISTILQDSTLSSPAPKIFKENCIIDWNKSAKEIHNFIRGLSPYPTAFTTITNKILKIFRTIPSIVPKNDYPGKIVIQNEKLFVNSIDYLIEILDLQIESKKRMTASEFLRGISAKDFDHFS